MSSVALALLSVGLLSGHASASSSCSQAHVEAKVKTDAELYASAIKDLGGFKPHAFLETKGVLRVGVDSNASAGFSRYCNKVKGGDIEFVCPPGFHGSGKGICKLKSKRNHKGADPSKYILPTKKDWPNALWGTVKAGDPTTKGHYEYKNGAWLTNGIATEICHGGALMNAGKACLDHCKKKSGFCSWCGHGNACCAKNNPNDPEECQGLPTAVFGKQDHHQCVVPKIADDVMWFADSTCHINQGETCFQTCNKVGRACDATSFAKITTSFHAQRAANQAGLTCKSFTTATGGEVFKGPWIGNSNLECNYHSGPTFLASCAVTQSCDKALLCPCKGNFIAHHPNEEKCPPGYKFIIDKQTCKDAARVLQAKEKVGQKRGHWGTNGPAGCFQNPGKGHINFNKDNTGEKVGMDGMAYICQGEDTSYMSTGNQLNECPEGYMRIKNKDLCLAAGKELHPEAKDGISGPEYRIQNTPHQPNGCYYKLHAADEDKGEPEEERIYMNIPTLPGNMLHEGESLICMNEEVMAEVEEKKAELANKNFPQKGHCAPGYKDEAVGLTNFGSCTGSWLTGYCVLPPGEAKVLCDETPECHGVSETNDEAWLKANPGMQQLGKLPVNNNSEWKTCIKGPQPDPCVDHEVLNGSEMAKLAASPDQAYSLLEETVGEEEEEEADEEAHSLLEETVGEEEEEEADEEAELGLENGHDEIVISSDGNVRPRKEAIRSEKKQRRMTLVPGAGLIDS